MDALVTIADLRHAAQALRGVAHRTPVATSRSLDALFGATVFWKCENLQRVGAFKFRGAYHALTRLGAEERRRGVVTHSSGNHAQAIALAGRLLGVRTVIVMPEDAPAPKLAATRGYGAEVVTYDRARADREALSAAIARDQGLVLVPPFDHPHVVAGQGTAALELFEEVGALDFLLVPCGGGGLLSGCGIAAAALSPGCQVVGVEPAAGDDATRSFYSRQLQSCSNPETIADGARSHALGAITFPLVLRYAHAMVTVDDTELIAAMLLVWERLKLVVEPTGALGAAALLARRVPVAGKRVGVVLSGGNVDVRAVCRLLG